MSRHLTEKQQRGTLKRIGIDILGVLLIIAAALTGWLPGPGGLPLLILGLSVLATNHEWAERLLNRVKSNSGQLANKLFDGSEKVKWLVDIVGIALIGLSVYLITLVTNSVAKTASVSLIALALVLLLGNRKRFHNLKQAISRK